jgi:hypothetical protein
MHRRYGRLSRRNSGLPFQPGNLAGIQAWYRADTVVLDGSGNVSQWTDLTGLGHHATQSTAGDRPLWRASHPSFNGYPTINFAGAGTVFLNFPLTDTSNFTIWMVLRTASTATLQMAFTNGGTGIAGNNSTLWGVFSNGGANFSSAANTTTQSVRSITAAISSMSAANGIAMYTDGNQTLATGGGTYVRTAVIGSNGGSIQQLQGDIAEIGYWRRQLSQSEVQQLEAYAKAKYETTASLPTAVFGLQAWYRADTGIGLGTGTSVAAWHDLGGNGYHATQATSGNQPTLNATDASYNNQPSLSFAGASAQVLNTAALSLAQPITVIVVGHNVANGANQVCWGVGPSGSIAYYLGVLSGIGLTAYAGTALETSNTALTPSIMGAILNGASSSIYETDPVSPYGVGAGGSNGASSLAMSIGATVNVNYWNGKIAEVLVYNQVLTLAQRQQVFAYLGARYGISIPAPISNPMGVTNCALWLRADLGITLNGSNVSAWADQTGNGNSPVQATGTAQPALVASGINSLPSLGFNGSSQGLHMAGNLSFTPATLFSVAVSSTQTAPRAVMSDASNNRHLLYLVGTNDMVMFENSGTISVTVTPTNPHIYGALVNGSSSTLYVDSTPTAGTLGSEGNTPLSVGCYGNAAGWFWEGNVSEIAMFSSLLSTYDTYRMLHYLGTRYGIAVTP